MMDKIDKYIKKIMDRFKEENGEFAKLEDGEEINAIFKDGVIRISNNEEKIDIDITLGKPYLFDENLDF